MADDTETWTPDQTQTETWQPDSAPVTAGGTAEQFGRGVEAGVAHTLGAPVDIATQQVEQTATPYRDLWRWAWGEPKLPPVNLGAVPGGSESIMGAAGQISPQLDPRNYPAQNWPERIARGAGDVGTQAMLGRAPSLSVGKILRSGVSGATAGAGAQVGRGVAESAVNADPEFRRLHPLAAEAVENVGGVIGGGAGGLLVPGAAKGGLSAADLRAQAAQGYTYAKGLNVNYSSPAVAQFARKHLQDLYNNYGSSQIGPIEAKLNRLANPPPGAYAVPMRELTGFDDVLGKTVQKNVQAGGLTALGSAARDTQSAIRDFIKNPTWASVHSGDALGAARAWTEADANWAAARRSEMLEEKEGKLTTPKQLRGFTPDEQAQIAAFNRGSRTRNLVGGAANLLGRTAEGGGLLMAMYDAVREGLSPRQLLIAGVPAVAGYGLHKLGDYLKSGALAKIAEQTRQRSPAYQATLSPSWFRRASGPAWIQPPPPYRTSSLDTSPFRTVVPVGLGAISGLSDQ